MLPSDPIPEYMELLDNLKLPKSRSTSVLVGIWVLNHGKLAPPPTALGVAPPISSFEHPPISAISPPPPAFGTVPAPIVPPSIGSLSSSNLATEVASLTPEQIQLMLRTLASSGVSPPQPSQPPPPIPLPATIPVPASSAWSSPSNPAFAPYPPPSSYSASQPTLPVGVPPSQPPYSPSHPQPPSRSYSDHYDQSYDRGGHERGFRGRSSMRARGRGRDRGGRPRDTGWPKERGRGRGGYSSPPRDRGRWEEQSRWN